jgi:uncharacterized protein YacL
MIIGMAGTAVISSTLLPDISQRISNATEEISKSRIQIEELNPVRQKANDERSKAQSELDKKVGPANLEQFTVEFDRLRRSSARSTSALLQNLEKNPDQLIRKPEAEPLHSGETAEGIDLQTGTTETEVQDPVPAEAVVTSVDDNDEFSLQQQASIFVQFRRAVFEYQQIEDEYSKHQSTITQNTQIIEDLRQVVFKMNLIGLAIIFVCTLFGYITYPLAGRLLDRASSSWQSMDFGPGQRTIPAIIGFFAGLLLAIFLLLALFTVIPPEQSIMGQGWFKVLIGTILIVITGGIGAITGATYFGQRDDGEIIDEFAEFRRTAPPKLLDTSVIIDGRIYDIAQTRFLDGYLVVTGSVLRELQTLADSADDRKRIKGRSGLELVQRMQDDSLIDLKILDDSQWDSQANGTDDQLMVVCRAIGAHVVTNDYNLNRVAAILNVKVLNINALANAVKTKHLPGDYIEISIPDRGKQKGQGVGYLEDGTMVVVEDGGAFIGQVKLVRITSVSQTAQGRLLFARVDLANGGPDA